MNTYFGYFAYFAYMDVSLARSVLQFCAEKTSSKLLVLILVNVFGWYYLFIVISVGTLQRRQLFCRSKFLQDERNRLQVCLPQLTAVITKKFWDIIIRSSFLCCPSPFFDCF